MKTKTSPAMSTEEFYRELFAKAQNGTLEELATPSRPASQRPYNPANSEEISAQEFYRQIFSQAQQGKAAQLGKTDEADNRLGVSNSGVYWTVKVNSPTACDTCKEMATKKYAEEPKRPHPNCKCVYTKHEVKISWTFDGSTLVRIGGGSWAARSGSSRLKPAPNGIYKIGVVLDKSPGHQSGAFCDPSGKCWSCLIEPAFATDRWGFAIHPDGNLPGTAGCIGISSEHVDTRTLREILANSRGEYLRVK